MFAVANLRKNQFYCPACKNTTGIVQVFLPYACKLLFQVSAAALTLPMLPLMWPQECTRWKLAAPQGLMLICARAGADGNGNRATDAIYLGYPAQSAGSAMQLLLQSVHWVLLSNLVL